MANLTQGEAKMRCLVIEDEAETADFIRAGLEEAGYDVVTAGDGASGLRLADDPSWDVIILDRMLPGAVDGLSVLAMIRELDHQTRVLILSALSSLNERVHGLRSGGDDYLTKPFALPELLARVDALVRRTERGDARELRIADLKLDLTTRRVERAGRPILLQPREFRLLEYLVRNRGKVITRTMLLERVWDYYFDPQTNVIDVQMSRLRSKIDRDFDPPLIHTVRRIGYLFGPHD